MARSGSEILQGIGYKYFDLRISQEGLPVLSLLSNSQPVPGQLRSVVETLGDDLGDFIGMRVVPFSRPLFAEAALDRNGEFACDVDLVEEAEGNFLSEDSLIPDEEVRFNVARIQTLHSGKRIDIALTAPVVSHFPTISGHPALRQMKELLEDYSKPLRQRKPGFFPWA